MYSSNLKIVAGKRILYVMATKAEYLGQLQARIDPFICQVGPVEAAMHMGMRLAGDRLAANRPDLVVSLGSGGSRNLQQAAVYQVSSISYRDMDASAFGFLKGETPFSGLPVEVMLHHEIPNIPKARLSTGAAVISGDGYDGIDADMVDMESWAVMRVCMAADVPMIGLRGISDGAEPVEGYADWTRYLELVDQNLALAVDQLETALRDGAITGLK